MFKPKEKDIFTFTFASRLRILLEDRNISKNELAKAIGATRQAVSQYCFGSTVPNADKLAKICEYLNVSSDYLLGLTDVEELAETDEKKAIRTVCDYTGLDEKAIRALNQYTSFSDFEGATDVISCFIANSSIIGALNYSKELTKELAFLYAKDIKNHRKIASNKSLSTSLTYNTEIINLSDKQRLSVFNTIKYFEDFIEQVIKYDVKELEREYDNIIMHGTNIYFGKVGSKFLFKEKRYKAPTLEEVISEYEFEEALLKQEEAENTQLPSEN